MSDENVENQVPVNVRASAATTASTKPSSFAFTALKARRASTSGHARPSGRSRGLDLCAA